MLFVGYKGLLTRQAPKVEVLVRLCPILYVLYMYNIDCVAR